MGFIVAIASAFVVSAQDVLIKKLRGENTFFLIWLRMTAALPVLAVLVTLFASWNVPALPFWGIVLGVSMPLEVLQFSLGIRAIQRSPLSLIAPLHATTAIFLIPVGYAILGEFPSRLGFLGVLAIVSGSFFLGWRAGETRSVGESFRNIFAEPGSYLILGAAFAVSISISALKLSFQYASPFLTAFYIIAALATATLPLAFFRREYAVIPSRPGLLAGLSLGSGLSFGLHYFGLSLLPAVYFISVKRVSVLFNVLAGRVFFREDHTTERFSGAILMVAGVILIAFG